MFTNAAHVLLRLNDLSFVFLRDAQRCTEDEFRKMLAGTFGVSKLDLDYWVPLQPERINACVLVVIQTKSNKCKERALVGEVISAEALAGQIAREFSVSDKGIDMEIEFNDDAGNATGKKLYLQLKPGDSHLKPRQRNDAEVFAIKEPRHVPYWMEQAFPVLLVVRNSAGAVRWMEVRDWLRTATDNGKKKVTQIVFDGERFDVMSIRRWRDRVLARPPVPDSTD